MQKTMLAMGSQLSSGDNDKFDLINHETTLVPRTSKVKI